MVQRSREVQRLDRRSSHDVHQSQLIRNSLGDIISSLGRLYRGAGIVPGITV
ncbi:Uncharacterized protein DAT39_020582 [Clarias magur]|uniref:Uncharacterized protein n=1 Tax=Clarias magur TaxID=1594786 RepID=A0A8J4U5I3_CLAMG|nr:Uncharacterized protein DAT39_020582 [Clarias magur]